LRELNNKKNELFYLSDFDPPFPMKYVLENLLSTADFLVLFIPQIGAALLLMKRR
jgi:hypothetical protein